jgi:hypothetical protein
MKFVLQIFFYKIVYLIKLKELEKIKCKSRRIDLLFINFEGMLITYFGKKINNKNNKKKRKEVTHL